MLLGNDWNKNDCIRFNPSSHITTSTNITLAITHRHKMLQLNFSVVIFVQCIQNPLPTFGVISNNSGTIGRLSCGCLLLQILQRYNDVVDVHDTLLICSNNLKNFILLFVFFERLSLVLLSLDWKKQNNLLNRYPHTPQKFWYSKLGCSRRFDCYTRYQRLLSGVRTKTPMIYSTEDS